MEKKAMQRRRPRLEWCSYKTETAKDCWELGEEGKTLPRSPQREQGLADTLILNFWPPKLGQDRFLLF